MFFSNTSPKGGRVSLQMSFHSIKTCTTMGHITDFPPHFPFGLSVCQQKYTKNNGGFFIKSGGRMKRGP